MKAIWTKVEWAWVKAKLTKNDKCRFRALLKVKETNEQDFISSFILKEINK